MICITAFSPLFSNKIFWFLLKWDQTANRLESDHRGPALILALLGKMWLLHFPSGCIAGSWGLLANARSLEIWKKNRKMCCLPQSWVVRFHLPVFITFCTTDKDCFSKLAFLCCFPSLEQKRFVSELQTFHWTGRSDSFLFEGGSPQRDICIRFSWWELEVCIPCLKTGELGMVRVTVGAPHSCYWAVDAPAPLPKQS